MVAPAAHRATTPPDEDPSSATLAVDTRDVQYAGRLSPEEFWTRYAEREERVRASAAVLACYGLHRVVGSSG